MVMAVSAVAATLETRFGPSTPSSSREPRAPPAPSSAGSELGAGRTGNPSASACVGEARRVAGEVCGAFGARVGGARQDSILVPCARAEVCCRSGACWFNVAAPCGRDQFAPTAARLSCMPCNEEA